MVPLLHCFPNHALGSTRSSEPHEKPIYHSMFAADVRTFLTLPNASSPLRRFAHGPRIDPSAVMPKQCDWHTK
ncbi:hypothetical protein GGR77_002425 [Xanthomonas translucens]